MDLAMEAKIYKEYVKDVDEDLSPDYSPTSPTRKRQRLHQSELLTWIFCQECYK